MAVCKPSKKVPFYSDVGDTDGAHGRHLECARLLLEAGASLAPMSLEERENIPAGLRAVDIARHHQKAELVTLLENAEALRYSPATHALHPRPARTLAIWYLCVGRRLAEHVVPARSTELFEVWSSHVMSFLVTRTSRHARRG